MLCWIVYTAVHRFMLTMINGRNLIREPYTRLDGITTKIVEEDVCYRGKHVCYDGNGFRGRRNQGFGGNGVWMGVMNGKRDPSNKREVVMEK